MREHAWDGELLPGGRLGYCRLRSGEAGATAVEFSIVLSLLVILLFGIIQFGIAFNRYQGLHAGAREGARFGALSQSTIAQIQQRVKDSLSVIDTGSASYVDPCPSNPSTMAAGKVCVNVSRRDSQGAGPTLLTAPGYDPSLQPCNLASGKYVIVTSYYRMPIQIPLWASATITTSGMGEFRCES